MTANINPDTGIAYGYISANVLDSDIVNELQMNGTDVYYEDAKLEEQIEVAHNPEAQKAAMDEAPPDPEIDPKDETAVFEHTLQYVKDNWDGSKWEQHFSDCYSPDEPVHEGEKDGVRYRTSWLGGALNVWVFKSPFVTLQAGRASPCVPNAGILDTLDGDVTAYNVPDDWRQGPDEGEIEEWCAQHHGRIFENMPEEVRDYWRKRYLESHGVIDGTQGTPHESGMYVEHFKVDDNTEHWSVMTPVGELATTVMHDTPRQAEEELRALWRAEKGPRSARYERPDCGEAGHADGACGNAQCLPAKATLADVQFIIDHGFHIGPRDPALLGVIFSPKMRDRAQEDAAYMVYDPSDDDDGFLVTGDNLAELVVETRKHIELKS
jgi:hypothetical protein